LKAGCRQRRPGTDPEASVSSSGRCASEFELTVVDAAGNQTFAVGTFTTSG
jgi:hypothetical protein